MEEYDRLVVIISSFGGHCAAFFVCIISFGNSVIHSPNKLLLTTYNTMAGTVLSVQNISGKKRNVDVCLYGDYIQINSSWISSFFIPHSNFYVRYVVIIKRMTTNESFLTPVTLDHHLGGFKKYICQAQQ